MPRWRKSSSRTMIKHESKASVLFRHWVHANPKLTKTCSFEMKDSRGKRSLPFTEVKDRQLEYAEAITGSPKGVLIRVQGVNGEPDYIFLKQEPSFIVVKYPRCMCIIYASVVAYEKRSGSKSLDVERAREIAEKVIEW